MPVNLDSVLSIQLKTERKQVHKSLRYCGGNKTLYSWGQYSCIQMCN